MIKRFKISAKSCIAVCFVSLSVASFSTQAQTDTNSEKVTPHEHCERISHIAEGMMKGRQNGVPITKFLESELIRDSPLYEGILFMAYESPLLDTAQERKLAISEFANMYYLRCRKAIE